MLLFCGDDNHICFIRNGSATLQLNKMEIKICVFLSTRVLRRFDLPDSMISVFIHTTPFVFMILVRFLIDHAYSREMCLCFIVETVQDIRQNIYIYTF